MKEGEICRNTSDCNPSLYCDSNSLCSKYKQEGDECTKNDECGRKALCYYANLKGTGACKGMFTVQNEESVGTNFGYEYQKGKGPLYLIKGMELLCFSQNADETGICQKTENLPVSLRKGQRCLKDSHCPTSISNRYGQCKCGFNRQMYSYCDLVEGDTEWITARNSVRY